MAFVVFNLLAAAALIGIDQVIKLWATNVLQPVGAMPLIPHVVELRFVLNPGMAFSLLSGKQLFLINEMWVVWVGASEDYSVGGSDGCLEGGFV